VDYQEAVKWDRLAADQRQAGSQLNLGIMYAIGRGVTQNYVEAYMLFSLAGDQGEENAREFRDDLAGDMTPEQISEAQRLAREWAPKAEE
jgi:hypothetical protein